MVELVRQVGSVGRETRELQETVRYLEFVTDSQCLSNLADGDKLKYLVIRAEKAEQRESK